MHQAITNLFVVCSNFQKLSPNVQKRLAVENDDKATQWSITDLLPLHKKIGQWCCAADLCMQFLPSCLYMLVDVACRAYCIQPGGRAYISPRQIDASSNRDHLSSSSTEHAATR